MLTDILLPLAAAWLAGGILGLERTFHGRAAGFRTHALVALAAAAVITASRLPGMAGGAGDAGRLAQGVMTGIGFLGAGVIFKEGINIQGLTTAATVWATSAIGLLFGLENYAAGVATTLIAAFTLIGLRVIEARLPSQVYARATLRFEADKALHEQEVLTLLAGQGAKFRDLSYGRTHQGQMIEFRGMVIVRRPPLATWARC